MDQDQVWLESQVLYRRSNKVFDLRSRYGSLVGGATFLRQLGGDPDLSLLLARSFDGWFDSLLIFTITAFRTVALCRIYVDWKPDMSDSSVVTEGMQLTNACFDGRNARFDWC